MPPRLAETAVAIGRSAWHGLDDAWCRVQLATIGDRPGLLSFMFHAVADDGAPEDRPPILDPAQGLSVSSYDAFVRYFLGAGYTFVSPAEVVAGLDPGGRYVLMTFDDGYYNNVRVVPVLRRHSVPAVFSISTGHVSEGIAFWWDVVYRERARRGVAHDAIRGEQASLKLMTHERVEQYLLAEFGPRAREPVGDEDRPLTPDELRDFASEPLVHVANHTRDHAILTNYEPSGAESQIRAAQDMLEAMTGERPIMIAYPNGDYSPAVLEAARRCGLEMGVTVESRRGAVPRGGDDLMTISRFSFTRGSDGPSTYIGYRSSVSLRGLVRSATASLRP